MIDNSSGLPFIAATIDNGAVKILEHRPMWPSARVLAPRLARLASIHAIRKAYNAIGERAALKPILQVADAEKARYSGPVVALSEHTHCNWSARPCT